MSTQRENNTRTSAFVRGLSPWCVVVGGVVVVGLSLVLPALLRSVGMGPVTATSVCMIVLTLLIGRYAPVLGLYPTRMPVSVGAPDAMLVSAAVLGGAFLWWAGAIVARLLVSDERNATQPESTDPYLLTLLFILVIAPVTEEILYRGLLQGALNGIFPVVISLTLTTVIFAAVHPRPRDMILAGAIGLLAGVLREVSGTMMMPILVHIAMNTASWLIPAAVVSHLAHSPAAFPVLILLGGAVVIAAVVLALRAPTLSRRLRSPDRPAGSDAQRGE
ncbi:CPBP family intramembrane glutamic endopeptidase [Rhodococcus sp. NCIMB 12038]|uniref:CPBP family intramembrane glutamic endopeptidase n=1 Tax=Rhodococcus sp. NCIMB 12038 TaxID=933800 RepID=UPI000B3C1CF1|nr:CPBP family intramembrane glutamic endopeptidase [Rhodococcus sp. NCIMB 12038]OUS97383.1 hypothetical protein CA951_03295 [Rhodococcus sp. NCIMB 12038]